MSALTLSPAERLRVERAVRANQRRHQSTGEGELNVVPFLDVVMNLLLFVLATSATIFTAQVTVKAPGRSDHVVHPPDPPTVMVTPRGYVVATGAGVVQPGCNAVGAGGAVTIPLRGAAHDGPALTACLARLRANPSIAGDLRAMRRVQIGMMGALPYAALVAAIDATRETRPGANDLFPDVVLGAVR